MIDLATDGRSWHHGGQVGCPGQQLLLAPLIGFLMATVPELQLEVALLKKIHRTLPERLRQRYEELVAKRRTETLAEKEHAELLRLTAEVEKLQVSRLEALAELARLRNTSLSRLRDELERSGWRQWLTN
jgi:formate dehydrogenase maturation protein FdhE